jgi:hypothetical protein
MLCSVVKPKLAPKEQRCRCKDVRVNTDSERGSLQTESLQCLHGSDNGNVFEVFEHE